MEDHKDRNDKSPHPLSTTDIEDGTIIIIHTTPLSVGPGEWPCPEDAKDWKELFKTV